MIKTPSSNTFGGGGSGVEEISKSEALIASLSVSENILRSIIPEPYQHEEYLDSGLVRPFGWTSSSAWSELVRSNNEETRASPISCSSSLVSLNQVEGSRLLV